MTITKQKREFRKELPNGDIVIVTCAHDDSCTNGHNTFSITCDVYDRGYIRGEPSVTNAAGEKRYLGSCGCQHDVVREHFPELAHMVKWHLCSTDGPLHYVANSLYWVKEGNLEHARSTAVAPDATAEQLSSKEWLTARLPELLKAFRKDVEALDFFWDTDPGVDCESYTPGW